MQNLLELFGLGIKLTDLRLLADIVELSVDN